ncbi:MAG: transposase [Cyanobacteria bacterium REEB459]|nr:transposase [Cyanobacteria bacterium REEB459]
MRDITAQLQDLFGVEVSASLISEVTDAVLDQVKAWQSRPLETVYPVVYLDVFYVNIKVLGRISKRGGDLVLDITPQPPTAKLGFIALADSAPLIIAIASGFTTRPVSGPPI